ncbi:hypothetical protein N665_0717s0008 [Sinapis alba]|nr:hypothetical protein N665_0717s0008 [Sinapis alba]
MQELRSLRIEKLKKQGHFLPEEDDKFFESVRAAVEQEENQGQSVTNTEAEENVIASEEDTSLTTDNNKIIKKDTDKESNTVEAASCEKTIEALPDNSVDNVSNLPVECYHYYYGSNLDMGRLIEIRREWDAYLSPGGSRIPGQIGCIHRHQTMRFGLHVRLKLPRVILVSC